MSLDTLKGLLVHYCHVSKLIENGDAWAVKTEKDRKALGGKANLLEEIIYEARNLKPADVRGPVWRNDADRRRPVNNVDRQQPIVRRIQPGPIINVPAGQMPHIGIPQRRQIQPGPIVNVPAGHMGYIGRGLRKSRKGRQSARKTRSNRN
jgi:hypothetical protein